MALDPNIPLQVQTPQQPQNALAGLAQIAQIKSASLQNALVTQEIQQRAVQAQQVQYQQGAFLAGQQALKQSVDPTTGLPDYNKASKMLAGQYPDIAEQFAKNADAMAVSHANAQSTVVDATQKLNKHVADVLGPSVQSGDQAGYLAALSSLSTQPGPVGQIAQQAPKDVTQAKPLLDQWMGLGTKLQQAKEAADANKANADAKLAGTSQQIKQKELDSLNISPGDAAKNLAAVIDPSKFPDRFSSYLTQYLQAPTAEAKNAVMTKAQEEAQSTSPTVQANKTAADVIKAKALLPIEVGRAVATESATSGIKIGQAIATAKALRQGDNPAVAGVAPAAVAQVQNQAIKLDQDYLKAKEASESLGRILDLAESGNKAAGSNVPLVGVETLNAINGIKRINSAEINQYGNAGSLLDEIKGKLGKLAVGKPIDQSVLNDIRELHQTLAQQGYQAYTGGLKALNDRTGAKYAPTIPPPNLSRGAKASATTTGDPNKDRLIDHYLNQ